MSEDDFKIRFSKRRRSSQSKSRKMSFRTELSSWNPFFSSPKTASDPEIGQRAPDDEKLPVPSKDGKPIVVAFLRHCGCPFAEKAFTRLRDTAEKSPDIRFFAVSHSDHTATGKWLKDVGGPGKCQIVVDEDREIYAKWGLGPSSFWHVLNPTSLGGVGKAKEEGFNIRPTESGSRWQTGGYFAVAADGTLKWGGKSKSAENVPDFGEAVKAVQG